MRWWSGTHACPGVGGAPVCLIGWSGVEATVMAGGARRKKPAPVCLARNYLLASTGAYSIRRG